MAGCGANTRKIKASTGPRAKSYPPSHAERVSPRRAGKPDRRSRKFNLTRRCANKRAVPGASLSVVGFPLETGIVVKDHVQQGIVDLKRAVVVDEPEFAKLIHEVADT
jgi:hypothetical protein